MQEKHVLEFESLEEMKNWARSLLNKFTNTPSPAAPDTPEPRKAKPEPAKTPKPEPTLEPPTTDNLPTATIEEVRPILAKLAHTDKKVMTTLFKNHGLVKLSDADPQLMALLKVETEEILNAQ